MSDMAFKFDYEREADRLSAENAALRTNYETACKLVADMHAAAMGAKVGPVVGVVEDVAALRAELEVAESALLRKGYRKTCDIAACNCGSQWNHGGNAEQRLSEIGEALRGAGFNGGTLLGNIETVCAERDALKAEVVALRADAERLDWLDKQWPHGVHVEVCAKGDGTTWHHMTPTASVYLGGNRSVGASIRAAIDAAKELDR